MRYEIKAIEHQGNSFGDRKTTVYVAIETGQLMLSFYQHEGDWLNREALVKAIEAELKTLKGG